MKQYTLVLALVFALGISSSAQSSDCDGITLMGVYKATEHVVGGGNGTVGDVKFQGQIVMDTDIHTGYYPDPSDIVAEPFVSTSIFSTIECVKDVTVDVDRLEFYQKVILNLIPDASWSVSHEQLQCDLIFIDGRDVERDKIIMGSVLEGSTDDLVRISYERQVDYLDVVLELERIDYDPSYKCDE